MTFRRRNYYVPFLSGKVVNVLMIAAIFVSSLCVGEENGRLIYLDHSNTPPFIYNVGEETKGALIDAVSEVASVVGYEIVFVNTPGERIFYQLVSGRGDLTIIHTYDGLSLNDYPDWLSICPSPIGSMPIGIYFMNKRFLAYSKEHLKNVEIGMVRFADFKRGVSESLELSNVHRFENSRLLFKTLVAGRIDIAISDAYTMEALSVHFGKIRPIESDVMLGPITAYLAMPKAVDTKLGIFTDMCNHLSGWDERKRIHTIIEKHMSRMRRDR